MTRARRRFLDILGRTLNPLTLRAAHSGRGPFSLIEHVGRKTGRVFEVPLILAPVEGGFITELTYGPNVNWLRNIEKAGGRILHRGTWYRITDVGPCGADRGRRAFPIPARWLLWILRKRDYRMLRADAE